jgi:hypothetical protein
MWRRLTEPARDPLELAMAADLEAEAGSDAALPLVEQLRTYQPAEADTVLATLRLRQSRFEDAAAALVSAFARLRVDPWPQMRFKQKALGLAAAVGERRPATARQLFDALKEPFSVRAADTPRLLIRADLTVRFDFRGKCQEAIGDLEPSRAVDQRVPRATPRLLSGNRRSPAGRRPARPRRVPLPRTAPAHASLIHDANRGAR